MCLMHVRLRVCVCGVTEIKREREEIKEPENVKYALLALIFNFCASYHCVCSLELDIHVFCSNVCC